MSKVTFDVYEHPTGQRLEVSVERALVAFRGRHGCEPAAVWVNPSVAAEGAVVAGVSLRCGPQMSAWYVYLELPAPGQLGLLEALPMGRANELPAGRAGEVAMGQVEALPAGRLEKVAAGGPVQLALF